MSWKNNFFFFNFSYGFIAALEIIWSLKKIYDKSQKLFWQFVIVSCCCWWWCRSRTTKKEKKEKVNERKKDKKNEIFFMPKIFILINGIKKKRGKKEKRNKINEFRLIETPLLFFFLLLEDSII